MSKRPYTELEDQEILNVAKTSNLPVGGEVLWKQESAHNEVIVNKEKNMLRYLKTFFFLLCRF